MEIIKELPDDVLFWARASFENPNTFANLGFGFVVLDTTEIDIDTIDKRHEYNGKFYFTAFYHNQIDCVTYLRNSLKKFNMVDVLDFNLFDKNLVDLRRRQNSYTFIETNDRTYVAMNNYYIHFVRNVDTITDLTPGRYGITTTKLIKDIRAKTIIKRTYRPDGKEVEF